MAAPVPKNYFEERLYQRQQASLADLAAMARYGRQLDAQKPQQRGGKRSNKFNGRGRSRGRGGVPQVHPRQKADAINPPAQALQLPVEVQSSHSTAGEASARFVRPGVASSRAPVSPPSPAVDIKHYPTSTPLIAGTGTTATAQVTLKAPPTGSVLGIRKREETELPQEVKPPPKRSRPSQPIPPPAQIQHGSPNQTTGVEPRPQLSKDPRPPPVVSAPARSDTPNGASCDVRSPISTQAPSAELADKHRDLLERYNTLCTRYENLKSAYERDVAFQRGRVATLREELQFLRGKGEQKESV
ncbi:hypothetical protein ONZ45_g1788 [Pleurotus djamor]|nr:hypothetical protein ONZ45_g1788 [Pleurotus djamor]